MSAPELGVEEVTVRRGRRVIVEGLSLRLGPGPVAWLVGENGGGKSSLLRVLAGLATPDAGRVRHVAAGRAGPCRAYYHPDMRLPPGVRVRAWQAMVAGLALPEREEPGLSPPFARPGVRAADLSTGEEKRLVLDAVLSTGRPFVFLDEPFEHLSPEGRDLLVRRLGRLAVERVVVVATNQGIPDALAGGPVVRLEPEGS